MKSEKSEKRIILMMILVLSLIHSIPVIMNDICIGSDCGYYLYYLSDKTSFVQALTDPHEPLFFLLLKPISMLVGEVLAIKLFQILSIPILLWGFYLLMKQINFKTNVIFYCFFLLTFSITTTFLWQGVFRNFLALILLPYLFYAYLSKEGFIAGLILILMALSHPFFLLPLAFFIIHAIADKIYRKTVNTILLCFLGFLGFLAIFYPMLLLRFVQLFIINSNEGSLSGNFTTGWTFAGFMFNTASFIVASFFSIFLFFKIKVSNLFVHKYVFYLLLFIFLIILSPINIFGRSDAALPFAGIILIGFAYNDLDSMPKDWRKPVKMVLAITLLFGVSGIVFLLNQTQINSQKELEILGSVTWKDSYLIVTRRNYFTALWLTEIPREKVIVLENYNFKFIQNLTEDRPIYILYDRVRDFETIWTEKAIKDRLEAGRIRPISDDGTALFGEILR